jgi:septum site-determining protein MinD
VPLEKDLIDVDHAPQGFIEFIKRIFRRGWR